MKSKSFKLCILAFALYLIIGVAFYFLAGSSLFYTSETTMGVSGHDTVGELTPEFGELKQSFVCEYDALNTIVLTPRTFGRNNTGSVRAEIFDNGGTLLRTVDIDVSKPEDGKDYDVVFEQIPDAKGKVFTLRLTSLDGAAGNAIAFLHGNSIDAGKASVETEITTELALYHNGVTVTRDNALCALSMDVRGLVYHWFGSYYWYLFAAGALLFGAYLTLMLLRYRKGKSSLGVSLVRSLYKYSFLIKQLVSRDFKTKYKRSVLGMLWSFLNPLLTMSIQYVVFSTLFSSDIENFVVYLLTGIICYNFFSEATNMCLMSIVGNAPLISKVYVPKYIYPFSRTLSSGINLLLSLIPLFICLFLTGNPPTPAILLLPFGILMLFMLSYGVGLILATMMVFFRDTQFLWNIATMLLMYLTPIFYPETIIPAQFMPIYKLNPLYHILRFMRSILIDGVSLEPKAYLYCIVLCVLPFILGLIIFRKNQDKFVLNI